MPVKQCSKCDAAIDRALRFCPQCGAEQPKTGLRDRMLGRTIANNFLLEEAIGTGAMGTIYRAQQLSLDKTIVIKLLHRHLLGDATLASRFHREARAVAALDHPAILPIYDSGFVEPEEVAPEVPEGSPWLAMPLASGTLSERASDTLGSTNT